MIVRARCVSAGFNADTLPIQLAVLFDTFFGVPFHVVTPRSALLRESFVFVFLACQFLHWWQFFGTDMLVLGQLPS